MSSRERKYRAQVLQARKGVLNIRAQSTNLEKKFRGNVDRESGEREKEKKNRHAEQRSKEQPILKS